MDHGNEPSASGINPGDFPDWDLKVHIKKIRRSGAERDCTGKVKYVSICMQSWIGNEPYSLTVEIQAYISLRHLSVHGD